MEVNELLLDLFGRVTEHVHEAVDGLRPAMLAKPPEEGANTIGWLVWHLTRVEDSHIAELVGEDQVWVNGTWAESFGVGPDPGNSGYGHTAAQVLTIRPRDVSALIAYYDAVRARTESFLRSVTSEALDRVVDENYDPPVTMGVRLVSVVDDEIQHAGQASYVRGVLERS